MLGFNKKGILQEHVVKNFEVYGTDLRIMDLVRS